MSPRFSDALISEVIEANDIVAVIGRYVNLKRGGGSYVGLCPFHREKTPSFNVSADKQLYHCFGCGAGGGVIQFIMAAENLDFVSALRLLADSGKITLPEDGGDDELYQKKQRMYAANAAAARFFHSCLMGEEGGPAMEYLSARALSAGVIKTFGIGYAPPGWDGLLNHLTKQGFDRGFLAEAGLTSVNDRGRTYDRFRNRIMFPIIDVRGNVIGFGGRILGEGEPKYLNSAETAVFTKGRNVFALNLAKNKGRAELIVVEGYMDVAALYQAGIKNVVAGLGTALTEGQAALISRHTKSVAICYDADEAGAKAADRALEKFEGLEVKLKVLRLPAGEDPDDFVRKHGGEAFARLAAGADAATDYKINNIKKNYNLSDTAQKVEYVSRAAALLSEIENAIERDAYITKVSQDTGISAESIAVEVRKNLSRRGRKTLQRELRRTISQPVRAAKNGAAQDRLQKTERGLLAILAADANVRRKLADDITPEVFRFKLHRDIWDKIKGEEGIDSAALLAQMPAEDAAAAAAALSEPMIYDNNLTAAMDKIRAIKRAARQIEIEEKGRIGDLENVNKIIRRKFDNQGREG